MSEFAEYVIAICYGVLIMVLFIAGLELGERFKGK